MMWRRAATDHLARATPPDEAIAVVRFRKEVVGNGRMELWLPDGGRIDFEIIIPVNIDFDGTFHAMDSEIARLEALRKTD